MSKKRKLTEGMKKVEQIMKRVEREPKEPPIGSKLVNPKEYGGQRVTIEQQQLQLYKVASLIRRGYSPYDIAMEMDIHTDQVRDYQRTLFDQLKKLSKQDIEVGRIRILEQYAEVKKEAWASWEKSKLEAMTIEEEEKTSRNREGGNDRRLTKKRGQTGDSSYLRVIMDCLEAERELLRLDPPKEFKGSVTHVNWDILATARIPDGPVPDEVEEEIEKHITALIEDKRKEDENKPVTKLGKLMRTTGVTEPTNVTNVIEPEEPNEITNEQVLDQLSKNTKENISNNQIEIPIILKDKKPNSGRIFPPKRKGGKPEDDYWAGIWIDQNTGDEYFDG